MTTTTYTAPVTTAAPITAPGAVLAGFHKFNDFLNVFFGATADRDSNFRGLDMNGNPLWVTKR